MKIFGPAALVVGIFLGLSVAHAVGICEVSAGKSAYDFSVLDVEGKPAKLGAYKGKVALIVNVASRCGYTPQYKDLQALYDKYKSKGFVVLGFPSNDFGGQEPGTDKEIKSFCETNFNVKFPLFNKGPVLGEKKQPLYKFLTEESGEAFKGEIGWNFEKFLVDKEGRVVGRYKSAVKPMDSEIVKALEGTLAKASSCTP
jgi:glutathione peroxidase